MTEDNTVPKIPGYTTYVVYMGDKISISMKPTHESGPLMTLDEEGRWVDKIHRAFYILDSSGALWQHIAKKGTILEDYIPGKFVPKNHLATLAENAKRRQERNRNYRNRKKLEKVKLRNSQKSERRRLRRKDKRAKIQEFRHANGLSRTEIKKLVNDGVVKF
jgi:hypothetical protein